jgi:hypothetical protein
MFYTSVSYLGQIYADRSMAEEWFTETTTTVILSLKKNVEKIQR